MALCQVMTATVANNYLPYDQIIAYPTRFFLVKRVTRYPAGRLGSTTMYAVIAGAAFVVGELPRFKSTARAEGSLDGITCHLSATKPGPLGEYRLWFELDLDRLCQVYLP